MDLSRFIDHTLLKPEATISDVEQLCHEAKEHNFAAVCVNPIYVARAANLLKGSGVGVATVAGFPLGSSTESIKVREAWEALKDGATEIDMVMSIGKFKSGEFDAVGHEIAEVVRVAEGKLIKVILETCLLSDEEIAKASLLAADAGAHYVKTSTGFSKGGATLEAVRAMKEAVGQRCKIKASGGIRTREQAIAMIDAGASRIGTSAGVAIVKG